MIKKLTYLEKSAKNLPTKHLVIASAEDENTLLAVFKCYKKKIIIPVLIGDSFKIESITQKLNISIENVTVIHEPVTLNASKKAVEYVKINPNCILMKGMVKSEIILKDIIKKDSGLLTGNQLSHVGLVQSPFYHKILGITDGAINIAPSIHHKIEIIKNAVSLFNKIGYSKPKVAVLGAVEKINKRIESTVHAAEIKKYFKDNNINNCEVDGPLALDNAISSKAANNKNIESDVAGDADILIAPNIDAGNVLYKCLNFMGGSITAGVIIGTSIPVVFTSRADSVETKFLSIILAAAI